MPVVASGLRLLPAEVFHVSGDANDLRPLALAPLREVRIGMAESDFDFIRLGIAL